MEDLQFAELMTVLREIRDDQREFIRLMQEPVPEPTPAPCTHPPELRTDSAPGARFWKCRAADCGYIYDSENVRV